MRFFRYLRSLFTNTFWLPCQRCGEMYSGAEWSDCTDEFGHWFSSDCSVVRAGVTRGTGHCRQCALKKIQAKGRDEMEAFESAARAVETEGEPQS